MTWLLHDKVALTITLAGAFMWKRFEIFLQLEVACNPEEFFFSKENTKSRKFLKRVYWEQSLQHFYGTQSQFWPLKRVNSLRIQRLIGDFSGIWFTYLSRNLILFIWFIFRPNLCNNLIRIIGRKLSRLWDIWKRSLGQGI